jgi:hypothetical protein
MLRRALPALCLGLALCQAAAGAEPVTEKDAVVITGLRNPDIRSYRAVVAGLDAFDQYHHYAPQVPEVRFRLQARKQAEVPMATLALRIVGDDDSEPIALPIDADGVFRVPRVQAAYDSKADLALNQKKASSARSRKCGRLAGPTTCAGWVTCAWNAGSALRLASTRRLSGSLRWSTAYS